LVLLNVEQVRTLHFRIVASHLRNITYARHLPLANICMTHIFDFSEMTISFISVISRISTHRI
jgi:hypothetical protein